MEIYGIIGYQGLTDFIAMWYLLTETKKSYARTKDVSVERIIYEANIVIQQHHSYEGFHIWTIPRVTI